MNKVKQCSISNVYFVLLNTILDLNADDAAHITLPDEEEEHEIQDENHLSSLSMSRYNTNI